MITYTFLSILFFVFALFALAVSMLANVDTSGGPSLGVLAIALFLGGISIYFGRRSKAHKNRIKR